VLDALEAVSIVLEDWLTREEATLTGLVGAGQADPEVAARFQVWTERLRAYEHLQLARTQHATASTSCAVEPGSRNVAVVA
jgi:hypothetical protein